MPITCDRCGKEATIAGKPEGVHWLHWMSDPALGDAAMVAIPTDADTKIGVICQSCVGLHIAEWTESRGEANDR